MRFSWRTQHWLWTIVLLGAFLRLFPIWFGLPYLRARPDEETAIAHAVAVLNGDFNPRFFHWPSLTFYVFAALFALSSAIRRVFLLDPALTLPGYLLLARAFVALAGAATLLVVFSLGRRVADAATGLVAALLLAVALLHVRDSHFAMTDVLMTLLVTVSLALLLRAVDSGTAPGSEPVAIRWFAAAGLTGGLAASTKYSAAAIVAGMGAAQLVWLLRGRNRVLTPQAWMPSVAFICAFGAGFIAGTPYAVLDFATFEKDLVFTFTHLSGGHGVDLGRGWWYHAVRSLPYGVGLPTFAAALAGVVPFARPSPGHAAIVCAFALAFYVSIGSGQTVFFRYVLPLVPILCLLAAIALRRAAEWLAPRTLRSSGTVLAVLLALVAGPSLVNCVWFDVLLARTDTRVLAGRWLEAHVEPGAAVHDAGGEYSRLDLRHIRGHLWYFNPATRSFGHPEGRNPDWLVFHESPLQAYAGVPPELRQLARQKYTLTQTFPATRGRARSAVYDHQDAFYMPVSGFRTVERPGPTILIYRLLGP